MELVKKLRNYIKDEQNYYANYIKFALLLNALVILSSAIYELGFIFSIYGQIVGILFLLTFFYNLGLVYLKDNYMNKFIENKRNSRLLTYGYLITAIITAMTLMSLGLGDIRREKYHPIYYLLFIYAFYISYLDYKHLITIEGDTTGKMVQNKKNLKLFLILFALLVPFFAGYYVLNLSLVEAQQSLNLILIYISKVHIILD